MPDNFIRILDLDGSVTKQASLVARYNPEIIDLKEIGPRARFWMNKRTRSLIKERLSALPRARVTFTGSGDFHHISDILIEGIEGPITVIDFDFHPDWDVLLPFLNCGSWVSSILKRDNVQKVIELGPSSEDLSTVWIETCDLDALKNDRLEIYPYSHHRTKVFLKKVPANISIECDKGPFSSTIRWNELRGKNAPEFLRHVLTRLPTENVYISIDKDCLTLEGALTNWEEGRLSLDDLLHMLHIIKEKTNIVGIDITGDYSKPVISGWLKNIVSHFNHPRDCKAVNMPEDAVTKLNEETNLRLLELLC